MRATSVSSEYASVMSLDAYRIEKQSEYPTPSFRRHLSELNKIVLASGSALEGNIFYPDGTPVKNPAAIRQSEIPPDRINRRANVVNAVQGRRVALEIGFNAGHSALLILEANPAIRYIGIDICRHAYTAPCADYLKANYGDRFDIYFGSSTDILPEFIANEACIDIDLVHVDGGHTEAVALADLNYVTRMPRQPGLRRYLIVDDTQMPPILAALSSFVSQGVLRAEKIRSTWRGRNNLFFEIMDAS
jgi:hypothetical protein